MGVLVVAQRKLIRLGTMRLWVGGSIPGLAQWVKDPALLWLWYRPAATAPIRPLALEPPYASGAALEKTKKKKKKTVLSYLKLFREKSIVRHTTLNFLID